ncbi:hypothetical protein [Streptomyces chartreusis]|uniref:hypothetical protein n=1 Tax=Streptomyces chartreusis TaxID=1969 RepID=UPI00364AEFA6
MPGGEYVAQFGKMLRVRGEIELVEEGQCGSRVQITVDIVEARPKTAKKGCT